MPKKNLTERVMLHADLLLKRNATLGTVSELTGYCKQTILNDIMDRLPAINIDLYNKIRLIMADNKFAGRIRGGDAMIKKAKAKRAYKRRKNKNV